MTASRLLRIELAFSDGNAGISEGSAKVKTVTYIGKKVEVSQNAKWEFEVHRRAIEIRRSCW